MLYSTEGQEIKAHTQKQSDGEALNGLTVDFRRDTWPAPKRSRNNLVLVAPLLISDFPFLNSAKRLFLCIF